MAKNDEYSLPHKGMVLIASPDLLDPNFKRSVVLLCEHNSEGSFGLILNKPLNIKISDAVEDLADWDLPLNIGGPVQNNTIHVLHRRGDLISDSLEIDDGVFWGGNYEEIQSLVNTGQINAEEFRFFLGYSGWGVGQLEDEMQEDSWYQSSITNDLAFNTLPEKMWSNVLRRKGGDYAIIANTPEDVRLN